MIEMATIFALGCVGLALALSLFRLMRGPTLADRILALDTATINGVALLMLVRLQTAAEGFFDVALLLAMVGFVSTVGFCKYLLRGDVME